MKKFIESKLIFYSSVHYMLARFRMWNCIHACFVCLLKGTTCVHVY